VACELIVRAVPRASKPGIAGVRGGAILIRTAAAPVDGAANAEILETLARALGLARRRLALTGGATSRIKRIRVEGLSRDDALRLLGLSADFADSADSRTTAGAQRLRR
jgi:uncharacterized protein YggU (UPF0235/DUF167 family)